tara:strand:- start:54 stop:647 length:594 start_codon:yes stop_codon:yes gene_type:complete
MPVTINGDGSITGFVAQTANIANGAIGTNQLANGAATQSKRTYASGEIVQSVSSVGTGCYNMTQTSWTEMASALRVTLPTVQAANTKILILFSSKMRHASHTSNITKQYRPAFSINGGSSFTNLNSHSIYIGSSSWGDDHIAFSASNAINMGGEGASFSDGVIFSPFGKTSNSSYGFQVGGCALGATTVFTVMEIKI